MTTPFLPGGPFELDITPSWWIARGLYDGGRAVFAALASLELEVSLTGYGAEVSVGIDGVTLRHHRPNDMTDKALRLQRLAIMRALEAARPSDARGGSMSVDVAAEQLRKLAGFAAKDGDLQPGRDAVAEMTAVQTRDNAVQAIRSAMHIAELCELGPVEEAEMRRGLALLGREDIVAARALAEARLQTGNIEAAAHLAAKRLGASS